ncbi:MAG: HEAT repeat domain-containing protein [Candidatus Firestonebacteria bacterium]|nr:HEAT repeat domain-containing protein [Candidatus Firestonebacteria bacterium]
MKIIPQKNIKKYIFLIITCSLMIFININQILSDENKTEITNLIKDLGDKDRASQAIEQLVSKDEKALIPELFSALDDHNTLIRKNAGIVIQKIGKHSIPGLSKILKDNNIKDPVKDYVISILGKIDDADVIPVLIETLYLNNTLLQNNSIRILITRTEPIVPFIKTYLSNTSDLNFYRGISKLLGGLNKPEAYKLLYTLIDNKDLLVRKNTVYALGKINTAESVSILAKKVIEKDEDIGIKMTAAISLQRLATPEAFNAIIAIFRQQGALIPNCSCEHDKKPVVPRIVGEFQIFVKEEILSSRSTESYELLDKNYDLIKKIIKDANEDIQIRYFMLDIIDEMNNERSVPFFLEAFDYGSKFRIMSIFAISHIGDKAIPELLEFIQNDRSEKYIKTLGEIFNKLRIKTSPANNGLILKSYENAAPDIKKRFIKIMLYADNMDFLAVISYKANTEQRELIANTIREENGESYFINILQLNDTELSILACNNLRQLKSQNAIPYLFPLLQNKDKRLQETAKYAIKAISIKNKTDFYIKNYMNNKISQDIIEVFREILTDFGPEIAPILIANLDNKDSTIVKETSIVLSQIGSPVASELIKAISDKSKKRSGEVISILKHMDKQVIPYLIHSMDSQDNLVVFTAKEVIRSFPEESIQYLIKGLENDNLNIRLGCTELLAEKKNPEAIPVLIDFLTAENKSFQFKSVFALVKYQDMIIEPLYKRWEKNNISPNFLINLINIITGKNKDILKENQLKIFNQNVAKIYNTVGNSALDKMIIMARTYKDIETKNDIFNYLKKSKDKRVSSLFIENLNNENPDIVIDSIEGLANIKEEKALEYLLKILNTTNDNRIRQSASIALKQITEVKGLK